MKEQPTGYDYMVGLLLVLQDIEEKTTDLDGLIQKLMENFGAMKGADNLNASSLFTQLEGIHSSLDLANLHNENAQKRIASIMETLKKKEKK